MIESCRNKGGRGKILVLDFEMQRLCAVHETSTASLANFRVFFVTSLPKRETLLCKRCKYHNFSNKKIFAYFQDVRCSSFILSQFFFSKALFRSLLQKRWFVLVGKPLLSRFSNRDKRSIFFSVPIFSIVFLFRLYFYISIKLMYWNSVCKISTNIYIYIYIVTYIIFVLDSFHI